MIRFDYDHLLSNYITYFKTAKQSGLSRASLEFARRCSRAYAQMGEEEQSVCWDHDVNYVFLDNVFWLTFTQTTKQRGRVPNGRAEMRSSKLGIRVIIKNVPESKVWDYLSELEFYLSVYLEIVNFWPGFSDNFYDPDFRVIYTKPIIQALETGLEGATEAKTDKQSNTVIVTPNEEEHTHVEQPAQILQLCSSEPITVFPTLTNRWIALDPIELQINGNSKRGDIIWLRTLPKVFYEPLSVTPNIMAFHNFIFGNFDIEMKFIPNGNKFMVGRYLISVKPDSFDCELYASNLNACLSRPNVQIDMSANNVANLDIVFRFRRGMIHNNNSLVGEQSAQYASVQINVLSPLRGGESCLTNAYIKPYFRFKSARFAGMSYRVQPQSITGGLIDMSEELVADGVKVVTTPMRSYLKTLENSIKYTIKGNLDKPVDLLNTQRIVPAPSLNFGSGIGASLAVPLRTDISGSTTYYADHNFKDDPKTIHDIAKIRGLYAVSSWKITHTPGTLLLDTAIDPTNRDYTREEWVNLEPTPVEYVTSMFNLWRGVLEITLEFISNSFHTGTVMISLEYDRSADTEAKSMSCYTKTFHLEQQKILSVRVPFIADTIMKRNTNGPVVMWDQPNGDVTAEMRRHSLSVIDRQPVYLKVRVINSLRPICTVPQDVDILVYLNATDDYQVQSLVQSGWWHTATATKFIDFPASYETSQIATRSLNINEQLLTLKQTPKAVEKGRPRPRVQSFTYLDKVKKELFLQGDPLILISRHQSPNRFWGSTIIYDNRKYYSELQVTTEMADMEVLRKLIDDLKRRTSDFKRKIVNKMIHNLETPDDQFEIIAPNNNMIGEWILKSKNEMKFSFPGNYKDEAEIDAYLAFYYMSRAACDRSRIVAQSFEGEKIDFVVNPKHNIVSTEAQMDIVTILRKPVLLIKEWSYTPRLENGGHAHIMIAERPPSRNYSMKNDWSPQEKGFNRLLARTPQVAMVNLFRFWRGTQRFHMIFYGLEDRDAPIYITHVPNGGVYAFTNDFNIQMSNQNNILAETGLTTDVVIPSVNATHIVEVPFDCENTWCLTHEDNATSTYNWRDKGNVGAGNLAITSSAKFKVDIWWAAGDDFRLAGFYGPPICFQDGHKYQHYIRGGAPPDPKPQCQSFDIVESGLTMINSMDMTKVAGLMGLGVSATTLFTVGNAMKKTCRKTDKILDKVDNVLPADTEQLREFIAEAARTTSKAFGLDNITYSVVADLMLDFVNMIATKSYVVAATTILRLLSKILLATGYMTDCFSFLQSFISDVAMFLKSYFVVGDQALVNDRDVITGICIGIVGRILNISISRDDRKIKNIVTAFFEDITSARGFGYISTVTRFSVSFLQCIMKCIKSSLGIVDPEAYTFNKLSENSAFMDTFIDNAQAIITGIDSISSHTPNYRVMVYVTIMQAKFITKVVMKDQALSNSPSTVAVLRLCSELFKYVRENVTELTFSPVKYEPFVIMMEGPPGIGKSHSSETIIRHLMQDIKSYNPSGQLIYHLPMGAKHWNNYKGQPVILQDEFLISTNAEHVNETLQTLFALKTSAIFTPPMASLEDKKIRANPAIVYYNTNDAYPTQIISSTCQHMDAVLRRRDIVIRARFVENYDMETVRNSHKLFTKEQRDDMVWARFHIVDSLDAGKLLETDLTFKELLDYLKNRHSEYHNKEKVEMAERYRNLMRDADMDIEQGGVLCDPFQVMYDIESKHLVKRGTLPTEAIDNQCRLLTDKIKIRLDEVNLAGGVVEDLFPHEVEEQSGILQNTLKIFAGISLLRLTEQVINFVTSQEQVFCRQCFSDMPIMFVGCRCGVTCLRCSQGEVCGVCSETLYIKYSNGYRAFQETIIQILKIGGNVVSQILNVIKAYATLLNLFDFALLTYALVCVIEEPTSIYSLGLFARVLLTNHLGASILPRDLAVAQSLETIRATSVKDSTRLRKYYTDIRDNIKIQRSDLCCHEKMVEVSELCEINYSKPLMAWNYLCPDDHILKTVLDYPCSKNCYMRHNLDGWLVFVDSYLEIQKKNILVQLERNKFIEKPDLDYPDHFIPSWFFATRESRTGLELVWDKIKSWWSYFFSSRYNYLGMLAGVIATVGCFMFMYNRGDSPTEVLGQSLREDRIRDRVPIRIRPKPTIQSTEVLLDSVKERLINNRVIIKVIRPQDQGGVGHLYCLGLFGNVILIPKHYVSKIKEFSVHKMSIFVKGVEEDFIYDPTMFQIMTTTDLAFMTVSKRFPRFANVIKYFFTDDDFRTGLTSEMHFLDYAGKDVATRIVRNLGITYNLDVAASQTKDLVVDLAVKYNYSNPGSCSSPVLGVGIDRPIFGFHVAGIGKGMAGQGYAIVLTQEFIRECLQESGIQEIDYKIVEQCALVEGNCKVFTPGEVDIVGYVKPQDKVMSSLKTKIQPSLIQLSLIDKGVSLCKFPAILDRADPRYLFKQPPLYEGIKKHRVSTLIIDKQLLGEVQMILESMIVGRIIPERLPLCKLTPEQAMVGIPGTKYYQPVPLDTSVGYPFVLSGKTRKLDYIGDYIRNNQQQPIDIKLPDSLKQLITERERQRKLGIVQDTIFTDCLKDELRTKEKVLSLAGTRVFCSSPVDFTIAIRQSFLHFVAGCMNNWINTSVAVGINCNGSDWSKLYHKIDRHPNKLTLDYKDFGASFNTDVGQIAMNAIINWTVENVQDTNRAEMLVLAEEMLHSLHLGNDLLYRQFAGSPSGSAITVHINSYVNLAYLIMAWIRLVPCGLDMQRHMELMVYGDDVILSVSDEAADFFNGITIKEFFSCYNIVVTAGDKSQNMPKFMENQEIDFLKRKFLKHPYRPMEYLASIDEKSIFSAAHYVRGKLDLDERTRDNALQSLLLAYGHGPKYYSDWMIKINTSLSECGLEPILRSWTSIDSMFFDNKDLPLDIQRVLYQ